jgi:hypothetical protein
MPGSVSGQGGRRVGHTGSEIPPVHIYRNEVERWCGLFLGLVLFRLVTPPLQTGVGGAYPVWGV